MKNLSNIHILFLFVLLLENTSAFAAHQGPLKTALKNCGTWLLSLVKPDPNKLTEFTLDVRDRKNRKDTMISYVASLPWKKKIGKWVKVTYLSDDMGEETVEQAVHSPKTIQANYPMVPELEKRAREFSKSFGADGPEVGIYVIRLGDQIIYTSEPFTSGHRGSISNEVNRSEWEKMVTANREKLRWPLEAIPEILFIHTHPTPYSPLSPPDIAHAERVGNYFRDHLDIPTKVTVIASPVPNEGEFLFLASVRR